MFYKSSLKILKILGPFFRKKRNCKTFVLKTCILMSYDSVKNAKFRINSTVYSPQGVSKGIGWNFLKYYEGTHILYFNLSRVHSKFSEKWFETPEKLEFFLSKFHFLKPNFQSWGGGHKKSLSGGTFLKRPKVGGGGGTTGWALLYYFHEWGEGVGALVKIRFKTSENVFSC